MNKKTIILVIILSILIGIGIFVVDRLLNNKGGSGLIKNATTISNVISKPPAPTPKPTLLPITPESNLTVEVDTLNPSDYSEEFKKLKEEVSKL